MKIEHTARNNLAVDEAFEMTVDQRFQERKCADAGALSWTVTVERTDDRAVVRTKRTMPSVGFPSVLKRFVPHAVTALETMTWSAPTSDGSRTADLHVDFHGAPVSMAGTVRLAPESPSTSVVVVDAVFTAHVPLIGRKIESFAAPIIVQVIEAEEKTTREWAAERR